MEEAYWEQFMTTGRIEDYLQFKGLAETKDWTMRMEKEERKGEKPDAGFGKGDSYGT